MFASEFKRLITNSRPETILYKLYQELSYRSTRQLPNFYGPSRMGQKKIKETYYFCSGFLNYETIATEFQGLQPDI